MTDQSADTTKVQLGEAMSFIVVTYRTVEEGLFAGTVMISRQLHHQAPHLPTLPSMANCSQKLQNLECFSQPVIGQQCPF